MIRGCWYGDCPAVGDGLGLMLLGIGLLLLAAGLLGVWWARRPVFPADDDPETRRLRRQHAKKREARRKEIRHIAKTIRGDIIQDLSSQGFAYVLERQGAMRRLSKPAITKVLCSQDAIYFRIDRLPFRKRLTELLEPDVRVNLSLALGRECRFIPDHADIGMWLQVSLQSGLDGIPKKFLWHSKRDSANVLEMLPKSRPWAISAGVGENRKHFYFDIRELPHLIVAGATGGGKSVYLNQLVCTLIARNAPDSLQLYLIDLKGGLEFGRYNGIPHLAREVIYQKEQVSEVLAEIEGEMNRRFSLFRNGGVQDIRGWNATQAYKLAYLVVVFDEVASVMLEPSLRKIVDQLINSLSALGRAVGIHLVLATQSPTKAVLSTIIRANIEDRIVFSTDHIGSVIALGSGDAANIPPNVGGRAVFKRNNMRVHVQCPLITADQIASTIEAATGGTGAENALQPDELFAYVLNNLGGKASYRPLLEAFRGRAGEPTIRRILSTYEYREDLDGPVIELDEGLYKLVRTGSGRQLEAIDTSY